MVMKRVCLGIGTDCKESGVALGEGCVDLVGGEETSGEEGAGVLGKGFPDFGGRWIRG